MPDESPAYFEEEKSFILVHQQTLVQFNAILVETSLNADEQLHQFFQIYQCIKTTLTVSKPKKKVNSIDYFLSQLKDFKRYVLAFTREHKDEVATSAPSSTRRTRSQAKQHIPKTDIPNTVPAQLLEAENDDNSGNAEDNHDEADFEKSKGDKIYSSPPNEPPDKTFVNIDTSKADANTEESLTLTSDRTVPNKDTCKEMTEARSDKLDKKSKKMKRKRKVSKELSVDSVNENLSKHIKIKVKQLPASPTSERDEKSKQVLSVVKTKVKMTKKTASFECNSSTASNQVVEKVMCKMENGKYVCEHCSYKTTRKYNMERHIFKHYEKPVCRICNTTFVDSSHLKTHMVAAHGQSGDAKACCSLCGENFLSLNALRKHKQFVHLRKAKYHCEVCDIFFDSRSRFDAHMWKHTGVAPHRCGKCGKEYRFKKNLLHHSLICTANYTKMLGKYRCSLCSYSTTRKYDINTHCQKHKRRTYTCKDCVIMFETRQGLQRHLNLNHKQQAFAFPCPVCSNVYGYKSELEEHMLEHPGNWLHHCPKCRKGFSKQEYLTQHLKRCGRQRFIENNEYGKQGKTFFCKLCNYKTEWSTSIKRHRFTHTAVGKPTCEICGKTYCCEGDLRDHMNVAHANAKFLCYQCGKEFSCRSSLLRHTQVTHELKYKYKCDVCSQQFTDKRKMADHMDKHTGARNHICHICGMAYRYRPRLAVHLRRHQNPEPLQCEYCKKTFKNSDTLRVHIMGKHLDRKYPCPYCGKDFIWHKSMSHHKKRCRSRPRDLSNEDSEMDAEVNLPQTERPAEEEEEILDEQMATDMVIQAAAEAIKAEPPPTSNPWKVYRLPTYSSTPQTEITVSNISGLPISNLSSIPMSHLPNLSVPSLNNSMSNFVNLTDVSGSTLTNLSVPGLSTLPVATFSNLPVSSMADLPMVGMSNGQTSTVSNLTVSSMSNLSVSTMSNETITTLSNVPVSSLTNVPLHMSNLSNVPVTNMSNMHMNLVPTSLHTVVTQGLPGEWKVDSTHIPVYAKDY